VPLTYVILKHILAGIKRFRTVMPCVSVYIFLALSKSLLFLRFYDRPYFLIDALRFRNTVITVALGLPRYGTGTHLRVSRGNDINEQPRAAILLLVLLRPTPGSLWL